METLSEYVDSLPIVSTHEHHRPFPPDAEIGLDQLFLSGYVGWCGVDARDRGRFLDLMSGNSYFVWYEKALNDLFGFGGEITEDNWDSVSEQVRQAIARADFHEWVYKEKCGYRRAVLDAHWDPGSDNGRPDLYVPTFRINSFLYGYHRDARDHNGNNGQLLYGECADLEAYLALIEDVIARKKASGCVCLKSSLAYDRSLDFRPRLRIEAETIFGRPPGQVTPDEKIAFGDFIFDHICAVAAKHDLPVQNHTGLGKLDGSNPLGLIPMIERHPDTKFVLFHGGYPWTEETAAMSHNYPNVWVDLCWLPSISTSAAERLLHSLIEAARDSSRITWGGDSWVVTESHAQSLAARHVVKKVLTEKVAQDYLTETRARRLAERILAVNATELYRIDP